MSSKARDFFYVDGESLNVPSEIIAVDGEGRTTILHRRLRSQGEPKTPHRSFWKSISTVTPLQAANDDLEIVAIDCEGRVTLRSEIVPLSSQIEVERCK
jgi:hypothetical protein